MFQCQECRKKRLPWKSCPGALEWYEPRDIGFCPNQVIWLLEHLTLLGEGQWPPDPTDAGKRSISFKGAYFETPIGYHAEMTWRLAQCGKDGTLAWQHYVEGTDELTLADLIGVPVEKVMRRLKRVLYYISGYNRKSRSYNESVSHRRDR